MKSESESEGLQHRRRRLQRSLELNKLVTDFFEKGVFKVRGWGGEFLRSPNSKTLNVSVSFHIIRPTLKYFRDAKRAQKTAFTEEKN